MPHPKNSWNARKALFVSKLGLREVFFVGKFILATPLQICPFITVFTDELLLLKSGEKMGLISASQAILKIY